MRVNEESALRYVTVFACARVLAETMAAFPLHVYRRRRSGFGADRATDHRVDWLLRYQPNPEMTSHTWRETQMLSMVLSGNGYSILTPNTRGEPEEIYPWDWRKVVPRRNSVTRALEYEVTDENGTTMILPAERMLHIPALALDGIMGLSPIGLARELVGLGLASTEFAARFYGQGMNFGMILTTDKTLTDTAEKNLREWIEKRGGGMENAWRPVVLDGGLTVNRIPMPLRDAQFVEQQKLTDTQICGIFRVPPHMVANLERATFSNIEHLSLEFVMYTMLPWVSRWEQALNWKLFTRREREEGYFVKFNVEGLLRGDYKSRQEGLAIQRQHGIISANEWRELEDMNPREDLQGDEYWRPANMVRDDSEGEGGEADDEARGSQVLEGAGGDG